MTVPANNKSGLKLLGFGALACGACCVGPILALLGGVSLAGLASTAVVGGAGLLIAAGAALTYLIVRWRRSLACAVPYSEPVPVAAPVRRPDALTEEVPTP